MKKYIFAISLLFVQNLFSQSPNQILKIQEATNIKKLTALNKSFTTQYNSLLKEATRLKIATEYKAKSEKLGVLNSIKNGIPYYDFDDNINAATTSKVNELWSGGALALNLSGNGIVIGHWEAGGVSLKTHDELIGRVSVLEVAATTSHATHTAGTMIASGAKPNAKGMAFASTIQARRSNNDEAEMANFAIGGGLVSNHSYSSNDPDGETKFYGYYNNIAQDWDEIAYNAPYYTICKSAGNVRNDGINTGDGGFDTLFSQTVAKNIITVGAVKNVVNYVDANHVIITDFSSYGPTDDGRIKPDIVANGYKIYSSNFSNNTDYSIKSGTSMATPVVTGAVVLLQEHYNNATTNFMKSATVKALLIASADEAGTANGPDYSFGWGLLNAKTAADIISNNGTHSLIKESTLTNLGTVEINVQLASPMPLDITLVWTDPAGQVLDENTLLIDQPDAMLVNDLDIRLVGNAQTYLPWVLNPANFTGAATKGDNFRDNVEQISTAVLPAGNYKIRINHKNKLKDAANQDFSLVINNIPAAALSTDKFTAETFTVFPNPTDNHQINIATSTTFKNLSVNLYDVRGRLALSKEFKNTTRNSVTLKTLGLETGVYFLKIKADDNATHHQKIIIK